MSPKPLRAALFGSPGFAIPSLEALQRHHDLALVVTQPDRPAGRGLALRPPPAAARARELGIEVAQPTRPKRDEAFLARLRELELDVAVTAAYGRILPAAVLEAPRHGVLNVHASLLPKFRGAAPVQWALIRGERETGISIMQTGEGLDTGPVRLQRRTTIEEGEDARQLMERLAELGAETLLEALELLAEGTLPSTPQDDAAATLAPLLTSEDGHVRWEDPAEAVAWRFRGVAAWPGTSFRHGGERVKVTALEAELGAGQGTSMAQGAPEPGVVVGLDDQGVRVAAGRGTVRLLRVKPPGRREMSARAWANGRGVREGTRLG
ncbi:MAG: methionyl-tRNA formyltransferase [Trueperaceae bacterium]